MNRIRSSSRWLCAVCMVLGVSFEIAPLAAQPQSAGRSSGRPEWQLSARPVLSLDPSGNGTEFSGIVAAVLLSDNTLLVADEGSRQLRKFGRDGTYLGNVMRGGGGPGELREIHSVLRVGDTLLVMEGIVAVHVVAPRGASILRVSLPAVSGYLRGVALGATRTSALIVSLRRLGRSPDELRLDSISIGALSLRDSSLRFIGTFSDTPRFSIEPGRAASNPVGFGAAFFVTSEAGIYCTGYSSIYRISCTDERSGRVTVMSKTAVPRQVTRRDADAFRRVSAGYRADGSNRYQGSLRAHRERIARAATIAKTMPVFSQIVLSQGGYLWVRDYHVEDGFSASRMRSNNSPSRWTVFDPVGNEVARCTLPARFAPSEFGHDYVLGVARDSDGVESVRMYTLLKQ